VKLHRLIKSFLIGLLVCGISVTAAEAQSQKFTPTQTKEIEKIVHDYLIKNPGILVEVSTQLQKQQEQKAQNKAESAIAKHKKEIFNSASSPVIGNPHGNVTLVEFMDYQCIHCKSMSPIVESLIKSDPELRVVIKQLPIFGDKSQIAAEAALASASQSKFQLYHELLMSDKNPLTDKEISKLAGSVGINVKKMRSEMKSKTIDKEIKDNFKLAQNLGLSGTPAFIIGNQNGSKTAFVPGATTKEALQKLIAQVRK